MAALETSDAAGAHADSASAAGNEDLRAAGGSYMTAGRVGRGTFDNNDESTTTGLLQNVRPPLDGFRAAPASGRRRGRRGGGGAGGGGAGGGG